MFNQDPLCRSKLICKLTGDIVNKTEEHIWKHINGKRFLNMLEKEEAEAGKEAPNEMVEDENKQKPEKASDSKEDGLKKKKKKKKKKEKKHKEENDVSKIISEVRDPEEKDSEIEDIEFWMPPVGDRWDFDDGKDRWASGSESDEDPENHEVNEADATGKESNETHELSNRTKRMSIEIETSDLASSKKKKKIQST